MWWLLKPSGLLAPMLKHYWTYYKPGYHPWQEADQPGYAEWVQAFDSNHSDPIKASEQMRQQLALAA
jgi:predicted metal-dependent hydrolase